MQIRLRVHLLDLLRLSLVLQSRHRLYSMITIVLSETVLRLSYQIGEQVLLLLAL